MLVLDLFLCFIDCYLIVFSPEDPAEAVDAPISERQMRVICEQVRQQMMFSIREELREEIRKGRLVVDKRSRRS